MKKRGFRSWVLKRIENQRKLTLAATVGMVAVGLTLFLVEGGLLFLLFWAAYSRMTGFVITVGLFGCLSVYSWFRSQQELRDKTFRASCHKTMIDLHVVPPTSQVWSWAFGSMDPDRSTIDKLVAVTMQAPRLLCAAWYTWHRLEDVQNIDKEATVDVMKVLFRSDHSVRVQEIADKLEGEDLVKTIRDVSLLDGVVFLTKDEVTLSVAPRLNEDLDAWRAESAETPESDEF
jgi:hypothetical protein